MLAAAPAAASAATRHVAPNGSGSTCSAAAPCGSFDAAYRAASPGDVVEVAGGSYGSQTVPALGRPAPAIEFRPAAGASVTLGGLAVRADHVTVRGVKTDTANVDSGSASDPSEGVTFVDVVANWHWLSNGRGFTWRGGSIGPKVDKQIAFIGGTPASHDTTYDGVLFHDATRTSQSVHTECLFAMGVQGLTVRNSRFRNCAVFNAYVGKIGSDPDPRDVLFENNVMEPSIDTGTKPAYYSMIFDKAAFRNVTLRNNTFAQEVLFGDSSTNTSFTDTLVVGNVMPKNGTCNAGVTFRHNVMGRTCGTGDKAVTSVASMFLDVAGGDYHLTAGAAAIGAADPANAPATDADGNPRSMPPDAGAYEFAASPQVP